MTIVKPISDIRSRPMAVMEKIDHLTDGGSAGGEASDEFRRMPIGEITDILLQQLVEQSALIIGNNAVADRRQHDGRAVGRESLRREDHHREHADDDDAAKISVDVGLVRHRAEKIGSERSGRSRDSHQSEGDGITRPIG